MELQTALNRPNKTVPEGLVEKIDSILAMIEGELQQRQTSENSTKPEITLSGMIVLKRDIQERLTMSTSLGKDGMWSSDNFYRHLLWLEGHVPWTEANTRMWIEAFFFRASAMISTDKRMLFNTEHAVLAKTVSPLTLSNLYSAEVSSQRAAVFLLTNPQHDVNQNLRRGTFFVVSGKRYNLSDQVRQAVSQIYAHGKSLQKKFIRGALTNGREWIFLHLKFTDTYEGASYSQSIRLNWKAAENLDGVGEILAPWPDLIAAVLADWIETSFEDIGSDDWFKPI